jgi:hypothetical protein
MIPTGNARTHSKLSSQNIIVLRNNYPANWVDIGWIRICYAGLIVNILLHWLLDADECGDGVSVIEASHLSAMMWRNQRTRQRDGKSRLFKGEKPKTTERASLFRKILNKPWRDEPKEDLKTLSGEVSGGIAKNEAKSKYFCYLFKFNPIIFFNHTSIYEVKHFCLFGAKKKASE